eukprot:COSAG04_NODE_286_length_18107_cov_8.810973_12_plen_107_part_00
MCTCQGEHRPAPLKLRAADALQVLQEGEHKETELDPTLTPPSDPGPTPLPQPELLEDASADARAEQGDPEADLVPVQAASPHSPPRLSNESSGELRPEEWAKSPNA